MATNYTLTVVRDDTGEQLATYSDTIAEGESDTVQVVIEDPKIAANAEKTSG